jgi:integrase
MSLTDTSIKAAKPSAKPFKLFDVDGLYMIVNPTGTKLWRFKYIFGRKLATKGARAGKLTGVEKGISLGSYPETSLKAARVQRDRARKLVASGVDPSVTRQTERAAQADTFQQVAEDMLAHQAKTLSAETIHNKRTRLATWAYASIGSSPISEIEAPALLVLLRHETAHRVKQALGQVFRYAIVNNRAKNNPVPNLLGALVPVTIEHHAGVTDPGMVGGLLRAIDGYHGHPLTELALRLSPLVFLRPGELRGAEWSEVNLDGPHPHWLIAAKRMKGAAAKKREHLVPLSRQAVAIFRAAQMHSAGRRFVFSTGDKAMSENTIGGALRALGYDNATHTPHGFRTTASTLLNELGFPSDDIELQLAHHENNKTRGAYNRSERIVHRRKMMQAWADHLDELRAMVKQS